MTDRAEDGQRVGHYCVSYEQAYAASCHQWLRFSVQVPHAQGPQQALAQLVPCSPGCLRLRGMFPPRAPVIIYRYMPM
jgi:hypothetical protein